MADCKHGYTYVYLRIYNTFLLYLLFFTKPEIINLNLSPLITACSPIVQTHAHTKHILPKTSCSACGNEKGVNCLQVPLCWCVLAGAAFTGVEKHREICSAVLPLSTMEDGRDWLTGFGAASGIHSQDPDHSSLCLSERGTTEGEEREVGSHSLYTRPSSATVSATCKLSVTLRVNCMFWPIQLSPMWNWWPAPCVFDVDVGSTAQGYSIISHINRGAMWMGVRSRSHYSVTLWCGPEHYNSHEYFLKLMEAPA